MMVGLGDGTLRLLDRRKTDYWQDSNLDSAVQVLHASPVPVRYRPAAIGDQKLKITSVNFNHDGTQLVASYSEDYVYLFNTGVPGCRSDFSLAPRHVSRPRYLSQCERYSGRSIQTLTGKKSPQVNTQISFDPNPNSGNGARPVSSGRRAGGRGRVVPAHKRIRLRGDWSDTGPEARPEDWESDPAQGEGRGSLMNRMSRLFERWMDIAMDSVSEDEGGGVGEAEREGGGEGEAEMEGEREGEMEGEGEGQREREGEGEGQREREGEGEGQRERGERERERKEEGERQREREGGMEVEGEGESREMGAADTSQHSNSNSESERNADRENSTESSSSCEHFSSDLQLVQEAAERSMQSVVQEAVQRAMDVSLGSTDTADTAGNRRVSGTVLSTGEATASRTVEGVSDPQSVRQSVSGASARPRDTDFSSPFSRSAELHSSQDEAGDYFSPPASPLVADVRETPPTAPPSSSGNRSRDRSPDHSYRRSRFRVQRKRTEKFEGAVSGGGCEDREEGERGEDGTTRRGNLACERCPQLQPFMVYKGHRNSRTMVRMCEILALCVSSECEGCAYIVSHF